MIKNDQERHGPKAHAGPSKPAALATQNVFIILCQYQRSIAAKIFYNRVLLLFSLCQKCRRGSQAAQAVTPSPSRLCLQGTAYRNSRRNSAPINLKSPVPQPLTTQFCCAANTEHACAWGTPHSALLTSPRMPRCDSEAPTPKR